MKVKSSNSTGTVESLTQKQGFSHRSIDFKSTQRNGIAKPQVEAEDFLQEVKEAIGKGDDTIWRMWR